MILCIRSLLLHAILAIAYKAVIVCGQSSAGFISIDCGKPKGYTYNDSTVGIVYTSDFQYIDTGEIHKIASSSITGYYTPSYDLRSFPSGERNCYTLKPVEEGKKYLVRASFTYGNYDGLDKTPQFDLYLGVNFWDSVSTPNGSVNYNYEIFTVSASNRVSVCLVNTGSGTPFISALELRPLPNQLYPQVNSSQTLSLYSRSDIGLDGSERVRYPSDPYDRFWEAYSPTGWRVLSTTSAVSTIMGYEPPSFVMSTASFPTLGPTLRFSWSFSTDFLLKDPRFHIFLYFAELKELNATETRKFSITLNDATFGKPVTPSYLKTTIVNTVDPFNYKNIEFSLSATSDSTLPPIINAAEVYVVRDTKASETNNSDVDAVMAIKASYNVQKNWIGDPCSPAEFMWDGLNCSDEGFTKPRILSLNLSFSGLTGEIVTSFANLTQLQYLDLSGNNLTGGVPDILANLQLLQFLDLSGNKLDGSLPKKLLDRSASGALILRYENINLCNDCGTGKTKNVLKIALPTIGCAIVMVVVVVVGVKWKKKHRQGIQPLIPNPQAPETNPQALEIQRQNQKFTIDELETITNGYSRKIGEGGFGLVFYGSLQNDREVAVKTLKSSRDNAAFKTELELLTRIHHKNLVNLIGYCDHITSLALVYEYMAEGSLHDHLRGTAGSSLSWEKRLQIAVDTAEGLHYLHVHCNPLIVHRDVKSNNILLDAKFRAKLSDFGISRPLENNVSQDITKFWGTDGYLDPECKSTRKLTTKSDVYSFGVVLLELITGLPGGAQCTETTDLSDCVRHWLASGEIKEKIDKRIVANLNMNSVKKAAETAMHCVQKTARKRPTMTQVLKELRGCLETSEITDFQPNRSNCRNERRTV